LLPLKGEAIPLGQPSMKTKKKKKMLATVRVEKKNQCSVFKILQSWNQDTEPQAML
jgi:hypothetical protein